MGLRDALVPIDEYIHDPDAYLDAVLAVAEEVGGQWPVIRLELSHAISLAGSNTTPCGVALWVDKGSRSPSWQKVSVMVCAESFEAAVGLFARAIDRRDAARKG